MRLFIKQGLEAPLFACERQLRSPELDTILQEYQR